MSAAAFDSLLAIPVCEYRTRLGEASIVRTDFEHFIEEQFGAVVAMTKQ